MYQPLVPCPSCQRHVRTTEAACPFCSAALPRGLAGRAIPSAPMRMSRAAAFVFGASLAVAGCGSDVVTDQNAGATSGGNGGSGGTMTGPDDDGGPAAKYGSPPPPMDAGPDEDAGPDDDGGPGAKYGSPPPMDAGPEDDGGNSSDYGAPPPPDDGGNAGLYGAPPPSP